MELDRLRLGDDPISFFSIGDDPALDFVFTSGEDSDLFRLLGNLISGSGEDPDMLRLEGDFDFFRSAGEEPDRLLFEVLLAFSSAAEETSDFLVSLGDEPELLRGDILVLFLRAGGDLD